MIGIQAYQLPAGLPPDAEVVDIAGFAYIYLPSQGVFTSLQAVSTKFKTYEELDKFMVGKGVTTWLRPSQST